MSMWGPTWVKAESAASQDLAESRVSSIAGSRERTHHDATQKLTPALILLLLGEQRVEFDFVPVNSLVSLCGRLSILRHVLRLVLESRALHEELFGAHFGSGRIHLVGWSDTGSPPPMFFNLGVELVVDMLRMEGLGQNRPMHDLVCKILHGAILRSGLAGLTEHLVEPRLIINLGDHLGVGICSTRQRSMVRVTS